MKPKLIIFDWDGTLADTTGPIVSAFRQTFADCGLPVPEAGRIRPLIGYSLVKIIRHLAPDAGLHRQEQLAETYARHYLNPNNHDMELFDAALPCLQTLKRQGYWLAVATGKGRSGLDQAIAQTGTAAFWLATACASEHPSKPAPDMVFRLCGELRLGPADALVVGDTVYDLEMAANAGARAVGVATGAHPAGQLQQADCLTVLNDLGGLPAFLETL